MNRITKAILTVGIVCLGGCASSPKLIAPAEFAASPSRAQGERMAQEVNESPTPPAPSTTAAGDEAGFIAINYSLTSSDPVIQESGCELFLEGDAKTERIKLEPNANWSIVSIPEGVYRMSRLFCTQTKRWSIDRARYLRVVRGKIAVAGGFLLEARGGVDLNFQSRRGFFNAKAFLGGLTEEKWKLVVKSESGMPFTWKSLQESETDAPIAIACEGCENGQLALQKRLNDCLHREIKNFGGPLGHWETRAGFFKGELKELTHKETPSSVSAEFRTCVEKRLKATHPKTERQEFLVRLR